MLLGRIQQVRRDRLPPSRAHICQPMRHVVLEVLSQTRRAVLPLLFLGALGVVAAGLLAQQGALLQRFGASTADGSGTVTAAASGRRPLRLLLVGHELSLTGAPQIQLELAIELRQRGHNVRWDTAFLAGANICPRPSSMLGRRRGRHAAPSCVRVVEGGLAGNAAAPPFSSLSPTACSSAMVDL